MLFKGYGSFFTVFECLKIWIRHFSGTSLNIKKHREKESSFPRHLLWTILDKWWVLFQVHVPFQIPVLWRLSVHQGGLSPHCGGGRQYAWEMVDAEAADLRDGTHREQTLLLLLSSASWRCSISPLGPSILGGSQKVPSMSTFSSFSTDFPVSRTDKGLFRKHDLSIIQSMCSIWKDFVFAAEALGSSSLVTVELGWIIKQCNAVSGSMFLTYF